MFTAAFHTDAALLAQPRLDPDRPVRQPPRHHRQRGARRRTATACRTITLDPAAAGLRDRPCRQVAHGQRRLAAAGLRPLGELPRPRLDRRSGAERATARAPAHRLYHRPPERAGRRFPAQQARQALRALLRAQGGASRRLSGGRRHDRPQRRRLPAGRRAMRTSTRARISRRRPNVLPPDEVVKEQAGLGGGVRAAQRRGLAQAARRDPGRHRGGDPPARRHDGLGRRGHGRCSSRRSRRPASSTTPSSCSWATTATSSASTGSGPERRFAYEEGITSPFLVALSRRGSSPARVNDDLVLALDIAPTLVELAGGKARTSSTCRAARWCRCSSAASAPGWRTSFLCEYFSENAMPWLIGMSYKAIRTERTSTSTGRRNRSTAWMRRALRPQARSLRNAQPDRQARRTGTVARLRQKLAQLVAQSVGL